MSAARYEAILATLEAADVRYGGGCSFAEAELNHLRDAHAATHAQRWRWLCDSMDFGANLARSRAARGLATLDPHGDLMWSPEMEDEWRRRSGNDNAAEPSA